MANGIFSPGDRERRRDAGIPDDLVFATKPQLAMDQLERLLAAGLLPLLLVRGAAQVALARRHATSPRFALTWRVFSRPPSNRSGSPKYRR